MGTAKRQPHPALIELLLREPATFDFARAVAVLEAHVARRRRRRTPRQVGHDHSPAEVGLAFRAALTLAFPARPIAAIEERGEGDEALYEVRVSFVGLAGTSGTLPTHYTEMALRREHAKDASLRDFLAALEGRTVAFFYRAARKYRLEAGLDAAEHERGHVDPALGAVLALVGLLPRPRERAVLAAELAQAHFAGLFSNRRRSAHGLRTLVAELLGVPAAVEGFVGRWIELDRDAQSRLGSGPGAGLTAQLGDVTALGARVWSVDSCVRVIVGPLDRARFRRLWPGGEPVAFLWRMLRAYLGPLIECELVWQLAPDAPAALRLGGDQQLGRDAWLGWGDPAGPDLRVVSPAPGAAGPSPGARAGHRTETQPATTR